MTSLGLPLLGTTALSPFLLILLGGILLVYVFEMSRHRAMVKRIPTRIHVNGTRGKSSVTRLIAAALRAGGIRTFAKTTGSAARLIHTDGSEEPVTRRTAPNIREQIGIVRRAAQEEAEALVIECMAIRPDLQRVTEERIVRSTIGVITNIRPDHMEVMGPTLENVAIALSGTIPRRGVLFTNELRFADFLREKAQRRSSELRVVAPDQNPTPEEMAGFEYVEIPENVALALAVCDEVGVDRATALSGMYQVTPDVGATTQIQLAREAKEVTFVNALAANDRESTTFLWKLLDLQAGGERTAGVLINNRGDRMRRAVDMAKIIAADVIADWYVVVGDRAGTFIDMAARYGVPRNKLVNLGGAAPRVVVEKLFELTPQHATVLGIGNMGGFGVKFLAHLEEERSAHAT